MGQECEVGKEGYVVVELPLPPGCLPSLYRADERFQKGYLDRFPGYYFTGDGGYRDEDGYVFITGRVDDVINVAGHRLSTAEMEEVIAGHIAVAECAVFGTKDNLKGQVPIAVITTKPDRLQDDALLQAQLVQLVRDQIGAVACMKTVIIAERLPKTRSGKILRKTMRQIADDDELTIPSTIENRDVIPKIQHIINSALSKDIAA